MALDDDSILVRMVTTQLSTRYLTFPPIVSGDLLADTRTSPPLSRPFILRVALHYVPIHPGVYRNSGTIWQWLRNECAAAATDARRPEPLPPQARAGEQAMY